MQLKSFEKSEEQNKIRVGCASDPMDDVSKEEGVGESGVKVMIVEVDNQKTAYILLDSNNMVIGFRERIIETFKRP